MIEKSEYQIPYFSKSSLASHCRNHDKKCSSRWLWFVTRMAVTPLPHSTAIKKICAIYCKPFFMAIIKMYVALTWLKNFYIFPRSPSYDLMNILESQLNPLQIWLGSLKKNFFLSILIIVSTLRLGLPKIQCKRILKINPR